MILFAPDTWNIGKLNGIRIVIVHWVLIEKSPIKNVLLFCIVRNFGSIILSENKSLVNCTGLLCVYPHTLTTITCDTIFLIFQYNHTFLNRHFSINSHRPITSLVSFNFPMSQVSDAKTIIRLLIIDLKLRQLSWIVENCKSKHDIFLSF